MKFVRFLLFTIILFLFGQVDVKVEKEQKFTSKLVIELPEVDMNDLPIIAYIRDEKARGLAGRDCPRLQDLGTISGRLPIKGDQILKLPMELEHLTHYLLL